MFSLLLLAALVSSTSSVAGSEAERHKVVIVGAGVSGFTAAATLLEHNVTDIVILEASDRIGGRIHTVQFGGVPIDKGAEFVHGEKDNAVFELVSRYSLLTSYLPLMMKDVYLNISGDSFNSTYVRSLIDQAYNLFDSEQMKNFNGSEADYFFPRLEDLLQSNNVSSQLSDALRHLLPLIEGVPSGAGDLTVLGARGSADYWENEGDQLLKWKTGGYKMLFDFLSKKFPNPAEELPVVKKTVLNKQVTRVEQRAGDVQVTCADGSTYLADHVIMTVSLGVLKKHAAAMFQPPLPADKTAAIQALGIGCVGKVFLLFPTRWWPEDVNYVAPLFSKQELQEFQNSTKHGSWTSQTTGFHPVLNHERMMCVWLSGQTCHAVESFSDEHIVDGLMELLQKLIGKSFCPGLREVPRPEGILRTGWASNPYTLGAYSYRTVESDKKNITNDDLASPIKDATGKPVIMFAGEATNLHHSSTVHGALSTGRREAHNLINYLNKHS